MTATITIVMAQLNFLVGDIKNNAKKILAASKKAKDELQADLIAFPELALTGYPPEDLLLRSDFHQQVEQSLNHIRQNTQGIDVLLGYPELIKGHLYNAACVIRSGETIANYHKQCLPNYGVFDEKRYFMKGSRPCVFQLKGVSVGLTICEDIWYPEPIQKTVIAGAEIIISINASPFDVHKIKEREKILKERVSEANKPIIYVHCIGGQDEIIFDGRSLVMNSEQEICHFAPVFEEDLIPVEIEHDNNRIHIVPNKTIETISVEEKAYKALMTGVRDYVQKNNFPGVLVGSSGGIDSALTLAIASDALGKENVHGVMMPSRYTSPQSIKDAKALAKNLGIQTSTISIEPMFEAFLQNLKKEFRDRKPDVTEENIQARIRGSLLMALSNKFGKLVLTTGNKSELAVGYATLYGDMAGGFAVLKDVYKTLVYKLAIYRNSISPVIPESIITKPPSAELAPDQVDEDSLPPYDQLDQILERYVEKDQSIAYITAAGFDETLVRQVIELVDRNEYKRRQGPPGVKITTRAFGRDRRFPITSGFKP